MSPAVTSHFKAQRLDGVLCCLWPQVEPEGAVQRRHLQRVQLPEEHQGFQTSAGLLDGIHQLHSGTHLHRCVQVANVSVTKRQVSDVKLELCLFVLPPIDSLFLPVHTSAFIIIIAIIIGMIEEL